MRKETIKIALEIFLLQIKRKVYICRCELRFFLGKSPKKINIPMFGYLYFMKLIYRKAEFPMIFHTEIDYFEDF